MNSRKSTAWAGPAAPSGITDCDSGPIIVPFTVSSAISRRTQARAGPRPGTQGRPLRARGHTHSHTHLATSLLCRLPSNDSDGWVAANYGGGGCGETTSLYGAKIPNHCPRGMLPFIRTSEQSQSASCTFCGISALGRYHDLNNGTNAADTRKANALEEQGADLFGECKERFRQAFQSGDIERFRAVISKDEFLLGTLSSDGCAETIFMREILQHPHVPLAMLELVFVDMGGRFRISHYFKCCVLSLLIMLDKDQMQDEDQMQDYAYCVSRLVADQDVKGGDPSCRGGRAPIRKDIQYQASPWTVQGAP